MHLICVGSTSVTSQETSATFTQTPSMRFPKKFPLMVNVVPPSILPDDGETDSIATKN